MLLLRNVVNLSKAAAAVAVVGVRSMSSKVKFLSAAEAQAIDAELFSTGGFSVDQLMELAGLSVAQAVYEEYHMSRKPVLVLCGPGNNGGDGLVAARHLTHFGMTCQVHYPRPGKGDLLDRLVTQCRQLGIAVTPDLPPLDQSGVIVDALFGFSFRGQPRPPFDAILAQLNRTQVPIVSVDVPSGWDVDSGPVGDSCFSPAVLVSLTAPKLCAKSYQGVHYLGGRFVPPALAAKYSLQLDALYKGTHQIVQL